MMPVVQNLPEALNTDRYSAITAIVVTVCANQVDTVHSTVLQSAGIGPQCLCNTQYWPTALSLQNRSRQDSLQVLWRMM